MQPVGLIPRKLRIDIGSERSDIIITDYPQLTHGDVYAALAYYHDNRSLVERQIREADELVEKMADPGLQLHKARVPMEIKYHLDESSVSYIEPLLQRCARRDGSVTCRAESGE